MAGVKFTVDDSELRSLLSNLKGAKREYRQLPDISLQGTSRLKGRYSILHSCRYRTNESILGNIST